MEHTCNCLEGVCGCIWEKGPICAKSKNFSTFFFRTVIIQELLLENEQSRSFSQIFSRGNYYGVFFKCSNFDKFVLSELYSVELRELEAKLKAGYMNKERAAQLAEKEVIKKQEEVKKKKMKDLLQCRYLSCVVGMQLTYMRLCIPTHAFMLCGVELWQANHSWPLQFSARLPGQVSTTVVCTCI